MVGSKIGMSLFGARPTTRGTPLRSSNCWSPSVLMSLKGIEPEICLLPSGAGRSAAGGAHLADGRQQRARLVLRLLPLLLGHRVVHDPAPGLHRRHAVRD